jgi:hypothetical protein
MSAKAADPSILRTLRMTHFADPSILRTLRMTHFTPHEHTLPEPPVEKTNASSPCSYAVPIPHSTRFLFARVPAPGSPDARSLPATAFLLAFSLCVFLASLEELTVYCIGFQCHLRSLVSLYTQVQQLSQPNRDLRLLARLEELTLYRSDRAPSCSPHACPSSLRTHRSIGYRNPTALCVFLASLEELTVYCIDGGLTLLSRLHLPPLRPPTPPTHPPQVFGVDMSTHEPRAFTSL